MLARQIENGAPYDVYLSARVYGLGRVAIWSKDGSIGKLSDLGSVRRLSLPNPAHAPYGVAARQALEKEGIWKSLEARIVYAENVRQALQFTESGNVDAAITAWSLVFDRGGILIPAGLHAPIRQAAGVVAASSNRTLLSRYGLFVDF